MEATIHIDDAWRPTDRTRAGEKALDFGTTTALSWWTDRPGRSPSP